MKSADHQRQASEPHAERTAIDNQALVSAVGPRLRQLRRQAGRSLMWMSEAAHTDISYLSFVERGSHTLSLTKLALICDALNISIGEFFEGVRQEQQPVAPCVDTP